ncbi:MAG: TraG/TraD/VirD4 family protein, partial [Erysipelotrichaceae bacterium]|nr:TraG/TraD/VirD4 family protein [Erysipelotrichaceae bacterium]
MTIIIFIFGIDNKCLKIDEEHVKDIIKNKCKLKIFISANDNKEAKLISDTLGNKTIQVTSLNSPTTFSLFNTSKNQTQSLT